LGVIWIKELLEKYVLKGKAAMANYAAAGLCFLAVPVLMGNQEWDDHDRSKKTLARDLARNYLESCPPNAILFSFGDNDTYPLWYAQEVEGIRPDVRVMVNTLLGTDWYMNQLRYKVNESAPFDVIFTPEQIMGDKRNVSYFTDRVPGFDKNKYYDLYDVLKNVHVVHYSLKEKIFGFDSSYRFSTLVPGKMRDENLTKESFIAVPGSGFMLLKEYGRPYEQDVADDEFDEGWDPAFLFASNDIPDPNAGPSPSRMRLPEPRYGYARYRATANPTYHDRGDLSLYYFPASRKDSCWSGMISQEQVTELNSPNLSYMMVPMQDRIVFLYNSFVHGEKMYASTTVIDPHGEQVTNEGILFWGLKNTLDFQQSRQVAPDWL